MSHASHSLPPSDRDPIEIEIEVAATPGNEQPALEFTKGFGDPLLRSRLSGYQSASKLSQRSIGTKLSVSSSVVSQYLAGIYPGDVPKLEHKVREFLDNESRRRHSGVDTVECEVTESMRRALEVIRRTGNVGVVKGQPGVGKTRAIDLYRMQNPLAILLHVRSWTKEKEPMIAAFATAVGGWERKKSRGAWLAEKLIGSERLLIVDDAHKLTRAALQAIFDMHDVTGIPVALIGTPALDEIVQDDAQRFRRVGFCTELVIDDPQRLVTHLVRTLCEGINGEMEEVVSLGILISERRGHFGDVAQQFRMAGEIKSKAPALSWVKAIRAAHSKLYRDYVLPK